MGANLKYRKIYKIMHGVENSYNQKLLDNLLDNRRIYFEKWVDF